MSIDITIRITAAPDVDLSAYETNILKALAPAAGTASGVVVNVAQPTSAENPGSTDDNPAPAAKQPSADPAPAAKRTRAPRAKKAAEPEPAPESSLGVFEDLSEPAPAAEETAEEKSPEPAAEAEDTAPEADLEQAVQAATELMGNGKGQLIKDALAKVGAGRVRALEGDQIAQFLELVKG